MGNFLSTAQKQNIYIGNYNILSIVGQGLNTCMYMYACTQYTYTHTKEDKGIHWVFKMA